MNTLDYENLPKLGSQYILRRLPLRPHWIAMIVVLAVAVFFAGIYISDHRKRERRYQQALLHLPFAQAAITGDARFSRVRIDATNGKYGVNLWVSGAVTNMQDYKALDQVIRATRPPVVLHFTVEVRP